MGNASDEPDPGSCEPSIGVVKASIAELRSALSRRFPKAFGSISPERDDPLVVSKGPVRPFELSGEPKATGRDGQRGADVVVSGSIVPSDPQSPASASVSSSDSASPYPVGRSTLLLGVANQLSPVDSASFRSGQITEVVSSPGSGGSTILLRAIAQLLSRSKESYAAYIDLTGEMYPPAAAALGVPLGRLLLVRTSELVVALRGTEALLRGGATRIIAIDVHPDVRPLRLALYHRLRRKVRDSGVALIFLARSSIVPADHRIDLEQSFQGRPLGGRNLMELPNVSHRVSSHSRAGRSGRHA